MFIYLHKPLCINSKISQSKRTPNYYGYREDNGDIGTHFEPRI